MKSGEMIYVSIFLSEYVFPNGCNKIILSIEYSNVKVNDNHGEKT